MRREPSNDAPREEEAQPAMVQHTFKAAHKAPGQFVFTPDALGRPMSAEGWLSAHPAPRNQADQSAVSRHMPGYHAGHLIPAQFGGPGDRKNLVPIPGIQNTSYVKAVENRLALLLKQGPVYVIVSVKYGGGGFVPATIQHEAFRRGPSGRLEMIPGGDVTTNVASTPSAPMSHMVDPYTGRRISPKEFLDPNSTRGLGPHGLH